MVIVMEGKYARPVLDLGRLLDRFARVNRVTYLADGKTPESDTDHTVSLGVVACAFAARYLPHLDVGWIAQYALVHDLVEAYAGDTNSLTITETGREEKRAREAEAYRQLCLEFQIAFPWLTGAVGSYEALQAPEAQYVKAMDKLMPKITHILNDCVTFIEQGMDEVAVRNRYWRQVDELREYMPAGELEGPFWELRYELVEHVMAVFRARTELERLELRASGAGS